MVMKKMKAFTLVRYGKSSKAFEERFVETPQANHHQVLIEVEAFGLNFADVMARLGLYQEAPPLPAILGYDVVGKITSIGAGVQSLKIGDRVLALTRFGGYAQFAVAEEFACSKIDESVHPAEACALATQFCTAQYMIEKRMKLIPGEKILVHSGAGGVGSALIQLAKLKEAHVITTVGSLEKEKTVRQLGADEVILYQSTDFKKAIIKKHGKNSITTAFDAIGGKNFRKSLSLLKPAGTICAYGVAENTNSQSGALLTGIKTLLGFGFLSPPLMMMNGKSFIGVNMLKVADHQPLLFKEILNEVVELHKKGKIKPLFNKETSCFQSSELGIAHELLETRKTSGKIVIQL